MSPSKASWGYSKTPKRTNRKGIVVLPPPKRYTNNSREDGKMETHDRLVFREWLSEMASSLEAEFIERLTDAGLIMTVRQDSWKAGPVMNIYLRKEKD